MKKLLLAVVIIIAVSATGFAQMKSDTTHMHMKMAHKKYTCTMHPEAVKNKPGKCPKCGMKLVPMKMKGHKMEKPMGEMKM